MTENPTQTPKHITIDANQAANMIALLNVLERLDLQGVSIKEIAALDPQDIALKLELLQKTLEVIQTTQPQKQDIATALENIQTTLEEIKAAQTPRQSTFQKAATAAANATKPIAFASSLVASFTAGMYHEEIRSWIHENTAPAFSEPK